MATLRSLRPSVAAPMAATASLRIQIVVLMLHARGLRDLAVVGMLSPHDLVEQRSRHDKLPATRSTLE